MFVFIALALGVSSYSKAQVPDPPLGLFPIAENVSPETLVRRLSNLSNVPVGIDIARCESQFDPLAYSKTSTAKGLFQFLDGTWRLYAKLYWGDGWEIHDVLNYIDNTRLGVWVLETYGTKDWNASKACWNKKTAKNIE